MNSASEKGRKSNPREKANILSVLTFFYILPTYIKGFRKDLRDADIFKNLSRCKSIKLGDRLEREWTKESGKAHSSLIKSLIRVFGKEYALYGIIHFVMKTSLGVIKPKLIGKLVSYFDIDQTSMTLSDAYFYGSAVVGAALLQAIYFHGYMLMIQELGLKIRIAICSLLYRKSLKLNSSSLLSISNGRIITSVSKDAYAFDGAIMFAHDLWIGSIQIPIFGYLMYQEVGWAGVISIGFLLILVPLQLWLAKKIQEARLASAGRTDERLKLIQEILTSIKIIKMYVWEKFFQKQTDKHRTMEMKKLRIVLYLRVLLLGIGNLSIRLSYYICILLYMVFGHTISSKAAFVVLGYYNSLRSVVAICIPYGISQITEAKTAAKRIKVVLVADELHREYKDDEIVKTNVQIDNADVVIGHKTVLENINLSLSTGLIGVTGPIGSGKSSLLKLIVRDTDIAKGTVNVSGVLSYASQEPWLFPATVKENILFGEPYNEARYQNVLSVCALHTDLQLFPHGDETVVIDKGLNLSKGQQARVNLARAVYRNADIYLLDDSLTALDAHVSRHIFKNCVKTFLKDKLVVLVTHSKQFLKETDKIVVLDKGSIENIVTPEEVDKIDTGVDDYENPEEKNEAQSRKQSLIPVAENDEDKESDGLLKDQPPTGIYHEEKKEGSVSYKMYKFYIQNGGGFMMVFWVLSSFIAAQIASSYFDFYVSIWVNTEQNVTMYETRNMTNSTEYFDLVEKRPGIFTVYSILILLATTLTMFQSLILFFYSTRASIRIHQKTFSKVMEATMNFFDLHLSGSILNRFSRDTAAIDEILPYTIYSCIRTLFILAGVLVIIASTTMYFLILAVVFGAILFLIKVFHMPTARSLKRLDNATRSPVVGHINASLEGLTTIRASNAEPLLKIQFDDHQDLHCSASYMYFTTSRAFGFYLEMVNAVLATCIIFMFIIFHKDIQSGTVGLAITQAFSLTGTLQWGMRMWAELENTMTSVERVVEYSKVELEDKEKGEFPEKWPDSGRIEFKDVVLRYGKQPDPILKNIAFEVQPKEKIGIIGRTGAGKSSIISTIFRLYPIEGSIVIDKVDIKNIKMDVLRKKISIIPQDPILFSGTLRDNLDPANEYSDEEIWSTLKKVNLHKSVEALNMPINIGGSNFSMGQKQLMCLGRAILRNNKILVLDEATANVDPETDAFIQTTIKKIFADCTILTIAHRLDTVLNSDKVMVMDKGNIIEFDEPSKLLENTSGMFYSMVKQSGLLGDKEKDKDA